MYLKPILFVMLLAAMGPGKSDAPPVPGADLPAARPGTDAPVDQPAAAVPEAAPDPAPELVMFDASEAQPDQFLWESRAIVVFADTPQDPAYVEQMNALTARPAMLIDRDVVVITDTDPDTRSIWRNTLHPRGFSLVLMDKDGQVKLRKPFPWSVREISRAIDKFPLRLQEIGRAGVLP